MNDDELRSVLRSIDPAAGSGPISTWGDPTASALKEHIMNARVDESPANHASPRAPRHRRRARILAAAAAVVGVAVVGLVLTRDDADEADETSTQLALPDQTSMASCIPFEIRFLRDMPNAFRGEVTAISDSVVTLSVDRWFASEGDETDSVTLRRPASNTSASLDGAAFTEGATYLISATNGIVNGCGFSGPATAELEASYEAAFER